MSQGNNNNNDTTGPPDSGLPRPGEGPGRPSDINGPHNSNPDDSGGGIGSNWGWIFLAVLIIILVVASAWFIYAHLRARRLGVPGPRLNPFSDSNRIPGSDRSGGVVGWVQDKMARFRRQRTAGGAYEGPTGGLGQSGSRRGRGMDPDEAWDTQVGMEADIYGGHGGLYEEQELGEIRGIHEESAYAGGGYGRPGSSYGPHGSLDDIDLDEGRGRKSELDARYEEETGRASHNPFDDQAQPSNMSLRGVSPRPHEETTSPTERRSMFKEDV